MDEQYFSCSCYSDEHTLRFAVDDDPDFPELYTSVFLNDYSPWYKRLWIGIKYIFGYKSKYGHWDCFTMRPEDTSRFRALIDKFEGLNNKQSSGV